MAKDKKRAPAISFNFGANSGGKKRSSGGSRKSGGRKSGKGGKWNGSGLPGGSM